MSYKIRALADAVDFETLPVAKIIHYPLEDRDYKPFAQVCMGFTGDELALRMWAFEVHAMPQSELRACLSLPGEGGVLHVSVCPPLPQDTNARNRVQVWVQGAAGRRAIVPLRTNAHNGEDLQGVYWGEEVFLPRKELGLERAAPGDKLCGNFYKLAAPPARAHCGTYFPAEDMTQPFLPTNMGEMEIVAY